MERDFHFWKATPNLDVSLNAKFREPFPNLGGIKTFACHGLFQVSEIILYVSLLRNWPTYQAMFFVCLTCSQNMQWDRSRKVHATPAWFKQNCVPYLWGIFRLQQNNILSQSHKEHHFRQESLVQWVCLTGNVVRICEIIFVYHSQPCRWNKEPGETSSKSKQQEK